MKFIFVLICVVIGMSQALTIEEAYEAYQKNPSKVLEPGGHIKNFDEFKEDWNRAQEFLNRYSSTEEAWEGYKKKFNRFYTSAADDAERFNLFKPRWEELVRHNEKYARGEIYYPHWEEPFMHHTEAELEEIRKRPVH